VNTNFIAVADALDLNRDEIITLARNSFAGSFLNAPDKARHLAAIDAWVMAN
jgi:adenosine deaminase